MRVLSIVALFVSAAAGYMTAVPAVLPGTATTVSEAQQRIRPIASHVETGPMGHQSSGLTLELVVAQVKKTAGADELSIDIDAANYTDSAIATAIAYEVLDDGGHVIVAEQAVPSSQIAKATIATLPSSGAPSGLANGYYYARATGAWSGVQTSGTTSSYLYFSVHDGSVTVIDASDWYLLSQANKGVIQ